MESRTEEFDKKLANAINGIIDATINERLAYAIYENMGQRAVHRSVESGTLKVDCWAPCEPCEEESPIYDNACLVCGTGVDGKEDE